MPYRFRASDMESLPAQIALEVEGINEAKSKLFARFSGRNWRDYKPFLPDGTMNVRIANWIQLVCVDLIPECHAQINIESNGYCGNALRQLPNGARDETAFKFSGHLKGSNCARSPCLWVARNVLLIGRRLFTEIFCTTEFHLLDYRERS